MQAMYAVNFEPDFRKVVNYVVLGGNCVLKF